MPCTSDTVYLAFTRTANAVNVHTKPESMEGAIMATKPSRTGSVFLDAPCIIEAVPTPASLTKAARLAPMTMTEPAKPPAPAFQSNAFWNMEANTPGTSPELVRMMYNTSKK